MNPPNTEKKNYERTNGESDKQKRESERGGEREVVVVMKQWNILLVICRYVIKEQIDLITLRVVGKCFRCACYVMMVNGDIMYSVFL